MFLGAIQLPQDGDKVYFKSTNTSRTIMSTIAQNIGMFGSKRCLEKFEEFVIAAPKTEAYANLDELMEDSHLYDLCFHDFDNLLFISPAG